MSTRAQATLRYDFRPEGEPHLSRSCRLRDRGCLSGDGDERGPLLAGIRRHEELDLTAAGPTLISEILARHVRRDVA
jgi:hypothetical protein